MTFCILEGECMRGCITSSEAREWCERAIERLELLLTQTSRRRR